MLPVSGGVYLPAFCSTHPFYSITCFLGHTPYYTYKEPIIALVTAIRMSSGNSGVQQQVVPEWLVAQKAQGLGQWFW